MRRTTYLRCHCRTCNRGFHNPGRRSRFSVTYRKIANRRVRRLQTLEITRCVRLEDWDEYTAPIYGLGYTD